MTSMAPRRVAVRSTDWLDASGNDDTLHLRTGCLLRLRRLAAGADSTGQLTLSLTSAKNNGNASGKNPCKTTTKWADDCIDDASPTGNQCATRATRVSNANVLALAARKHSRDATLRHSREILDV
jgi:hypothetical protein